MGTPSFLKTIMKNHGLLHLLHQVTVVRGSRIGRPHMNPYSFPWGRMGPFPLGPMGPGPHGVQAHAEPEDLGARAHEEPEDPFWRPIRDPRTTVT